MAGHGETFLLVDFSVLMIDTPQFTPLSLQPPPPTQLPHPQLLPPPTFTPPPPQLLPLTPTPNFYPRPNKTAAKLSEFF